MGKGGTRFVGDALGARAGRAKGYTAKERTKDMETFLATGVHPEVQRLRNAGNHTVPPLPPPKPTRPRIFLNLTISKRAAGRVVIELFDDIVPAPAGHLLGRCTKGTTEGLAGTKVHKVLPGLAILGGRTVKHMEAVQMKRDASLRHVERGVVSISIDGTEICITLARALHLDDTHQVVGRVQAGMEVIEKVSALPTTADDGPAHAVTITRCGVTDAAGEAEFDVVEDDAGKKGGASAAEALERDVAETRQAVSEALQAGLKRKAGEGGQSKEAVKKLVKQTAMDAVLLGGSSDGSDSDSESD